MLLPYKHHITDLIVLDAHIKTLHGENRATLADIRQQYWIIGGKRKVKFILNKCVKCLRYKSTTASQLMGQLPTPRVTESYPFSHSGVDYAGPIQVRTMKGRGNKSYKGYIAVFIHMSSNKSSAFGTCRGFVNRNVHSSVQEIFRATRPFIACIQ